MQKRSMPPYVYHDEKIQLSEKNKTNTTEKNLMKRGPVHIVEKYTVHTKEEIIIIIIIIVGRPIYKALLTKIKALYKESRETRTKQKRKRKRNQAVATEAMKREVF